MWQRSTRARARQRTAPLAAFAITAATFLARTTSALRASTALLVSVAATFLACAAAEPRDTTVVHLTDPVPTTAPLAADPTLLDPEPAPRTPRRAASPPDDSPARDPHEADRERARDLFQQGAEAYQQGDFVKARDAFQAAYDLVPEQALLFNIATAELRLGDLPSACAHLRKYVIHGDPADPRIITVRAQTSQRCAGVP